MSRHTLSNGITPDPRITKQTYDMWLPELAPSPKLVGDYYKRGLPWDEYCITYNEQLNDKRKIILMRNLGNIALENNITLMCIEPYEDGKILLCHRRLLANRIQEINSDISTYIR
jgi:uncharacterized protein YeaO (DUF488 family)